MNYIGKFVSNIREFYNDLNPATLSGAIDVVVVEQEDGSFACSPFHVRFGKRGVFNRREKIVDITINGEPVDLHMKLGETGEAFFVQENELEEDTEISPLLATSPLPSSYISELIINKPLSLPPAPPPSLASSLPIPPPSKFEETASPASSNSSGTLRNVREESDSPPRERQHSGNSADDADRPISDTSSSSKVKSRSRRKRRTKVRPSKDEEIFRMDLSDDDRETTPVDDETEFNKGSLGRTSSLPDILDSSPVDAPSTEEGAVDAGKLRQRRVSTHSGSYIPKHLHVTFAPSFVPRKMSTGEVQATKSEGQLTPPKTSLDNNVASGFLSDSEVDLKKSETRKVTEDEGANVTWKWGQLPEKNAAKTPDTMTPTLQGSLESIPEASRQNPPTTAEEQEKRSYLRGMFSFIRRPKPSAPITTSTKDVPKPKDDTEEMGKYLSDLATENISQSQKAKYLALDSLGVGVDAADRTPTPQFENHPEPVPSDPNHPPSAIQPASAENVATKGLAFPATVEVEGKSIELVPLAAQERATGVDAIVNAFGQDARSSSAYSSMTGSPPLSDSESDKTSENLTSVRPTNLTYTKTLRLTSDQIMTLPLQHGVNEAEFCIVTKYQGSARCKCNIFLWRFDDKIVISDIDGTITKSDVLGHILPIIGSTWAQAGVAGLYNRIANNGYRFLYLSSRAIGQASFTRDHLKAIIQENVNLPEGPLLLSPKSLFLAFHQEVIVKRPEEFKIACLKDIRALFSPDRNPFFAAYGNKTTDLLSYRTVGVPMTRIFTINYQGQLKHEILRQAQSSYSQQSNLVDMLFPPMMSLPGSHVQISEHEHADEYSSFVYWKAPLPDINATFLLPPPEPEPVPVKTKKAKTTKDANQNTSHPPKSVSPVKSARNAPLIIM